MEKHAKALSNFGATSIRTQVPIALYWIDPVHPSLGAFFDAMKLTLERKILKLKINVGGDVVKIIRERVCGIMIPTTLDDTSEIIPHSTLHLFHTLNLGSGLLRNNLMTTSDPTPLNAFYQMKKKSTPPYQDEGKVIVVGDTRPAGEVEI